MKRFNEMITQEKAFSTLDELARSRMIYEQTVISEIEPRKAQRALLKLLPKLAERKKALQLVGDVIGDPAELGEDCCKTWDELEVLLRKK